MKHILLDKIHIYEKKVGKQSETIGSTYISKKGYWIDGETTHPLVLSPRRPLPSTKKADVERGEDLK